MVSSFGPLFPFSNFNQFRMVSSCKKNSKSNLPSSLCVVLANMLGMARHDVVGRNDALPHLGLQLCFFLFLFFCLKTLQDLGRVSM